MYLVRSLVGVVKHGTVRSTGQQCLGTRALVRLRENMQRRVPHVVFTVGLGAVEKEEFDKGVVAFEGCWKRVCL